MNAQTENITITNTELWRLLDIAATKGVIAGVLAGSAHTSNTGTDVDSMVDKIIGDIVIEQKLQSFWSV